MKLPFRPFFRRPETPTPIPPAPTRCTLQAVCDPSRERMVRALCLVAFANTDVRPKLHHTLEPDGNAHLTIHVTLTSDGPSTAALERLVVQLTRIPRVRHLRWAMHTGETADPNPPAFLPGRDRVGTCR
ncbi:hypothetical protein [Streptomyces sp. YGL11-2]|uniref:hypothetical protein n=1 Tax=Streptomyces sp. YGL11-2 TaxID=3414028 RepID=UPI003CF12C5F